MSDIMTAVDHELARARERVDRVARLVAHASARLATMHSTEDDTADDVAYLRERADAWQQVEALLAPVAAHIAAPVAAEPSVSTGAVVGEDAGSGQVER